MPLYSVAKPATSSDSASGRVERRAVSFGQRGDEEQQESRER
jgi:hypothetical protein